MLVRTLALLIFALLSVGEEARGQTPGHVVDDGNGDDVGCVVTGTITRHSDELVRLNVGDGYTLEVTPRHRLYSATRGQWVAAGDLGEEDLRTQSGTTHVQPAGDLPGPVQVFNLEVFGTHRYLVGQTRVLAHNSYAERARGARPPNMSPAGAGRRGAFRAAKRHSGIPVSQQPSRVVRNLDRRGNPQPGRTYEFEIPAGGGGTRIVRIRDDSAGHFFGPGNPQNRGPHFNDERGYHYDY